MCKMVPRDSPHSYSELVKAFSDLKFSMDTEER